MFHVISFIQWRVCFSLSRLSRSYLCIYFLWGFQQWRFHNNSSDRQQRRVGIYSRKLIGSLLDVEINAAVCRSYDVNERKRVTIPHKFEYFSS